MQLLVPLTVLLVNLLTIAASAKSTCTCYPEVESKAYQGDARKKHFIGYSINWSCDYKCEVISEIEKKSQVVTGFYSKYYFRNTEMGTEGICEGMVYEPQFVMSLGREIYMFHGKTFGIVASKSESKDLKAWAAKNNCD